MSEVEKEGKLRSSAYNIVFSPRPGKLIVILEHIHVHVKFTV
jgi:hypothetical protein